jgi:hypothetical protein
VLLCRDVRPTALIDHVPLQCAVARAPVAVLSGGGSSASLGAAVLGTTRLACLALLRGTPCGALEPLAARIAAIAGTAVPAIPWDPAVLQQPVYARVNIGSGDMRARKAHRAEVLAARKVRRVARVKARRRAQSAAKRIDKKRVAEQGGAAAHGGSAAAAAVQGAAKNKKRPAGEGGQRSR